MAQVAFNVTTSLTGLAESTTYHVRLMADLGGSVPAQRGNWCSTAENRQCR